MADKDKAGSLSQEQLKEVERLRQRLDLLDERIDNIDSVVSAVVERVMKQSLVVNLTCPRCGKKVEVALIGTAKPT